MDSKLTKFDKDMSAVTFAEANEHETATELLGNETVEQKVASPAAKKMPYLGMVIFGAVSLTGYVVLVTNQKLISDIYTMGGWHAAYPVLTALAFSFIHGAFASNLLSVLGLEAKKH